MPFDNNNIPYRNSCKDCEYERYCNLDPREKMFNRKCYVDYIAEKLKITPKILLERCYKFEVKYGIDFSGVKHYDYNHWIQLSGREREEYVPTHHLKYLLNRNGKDATEYRKSEGQLYAAMVNTYFNCWLDEDYIQCSRCGKVIKNSKQRNRRFCRECGGYQKKGIQYAICFDCGEEFLKESNNQYRCYDCQVTADKAAAKERARKYRERKNHGSN